MKTRTDFVTNSSSANYCVTLKLDGGAGHHAEIEVHTYDSHPWYEDTDEGCKNYDGRARALSYHVNDAVARAKGCESARELSDALLSAVREYGWGVSYDWWQERENWSYFQARWYRDHLLEARETGVEESREKPWTFDFDKYVAELRSQGKMLEGLQPKYPSRILAEEMGDFRRRWYRKFVENICGGWSFAIVGEPRVYESLEDLESYIIGHGGTVDDRVETTTDFVIFCDDGRAQADGGEAYWTFDAYGDTDNLERDLTEPGTQVSYEWKRYEGADDGFCGTLDYCSSFVLTEGCFDSLFEDAFGDIVSDGVLDVSYFVIPEHEFVRRFDPEREKSDWMPIDVAHPIIAHRFAQVLESRDITPENLEAVSYERHIGTFGDSRRLLGFYDSERGTDVEYGDDGRASWWSWGDSEDIDWAYRDD